MRVTFLGNWSVDYTSESHHAASLEELGVEVVRLQEPKAPWQQILTEAEKSDMFAWIKTHGWDTPGIENVLSRLKELGIPVVS